MSQVKEHAVEEEIQQEECEQAVPHILTLSNYSSYQKLLRITAYILRFANNCRQSKNDRICGDIISQELNQASKYWIKVVQQESYGDVKESLNNTKRNHLIRQLKLFMDSNGLIRCQGRIHNAPLPDDTKFPLLLPKSHAFTKLIIEDTHRRNLHCGPEATIVTLREKFWIPSFRQEVRNCLRKCVPCRKVTGKSFLAPDPPPLPINRLKDYTPFTVTGVDFTGALHVKMKNSRDKKVYICLFTCASTRAIHLEIVSDLTEDSFIMAFRRFVSKKSTPQTMISDNGTTFLAAAETVKSITNSRVVKEKLQEHGTEWTFIPKRAPWFGGFWERLIGIVKTTIFKVLGSAYITVEELSTLISEVEMIINDRPITHVSVDNRDPEPLTPSHLLYGRRISSPVYPDERQTPHGPVSHVTLNNQYSRKTEILQHIWTRWKKEYLTSLREFQRASGTVKETIKIGDMVQIHDDTKRIYWKLGVVEDHIIGGDGHARAAIVRTRSGRTNRPITKLFPLEINVNEPRRSERLTKS